MDYTYYGDLLGIGNYYQLSPNIAKEKLNQFYNLSFEHLAVLRKEIDPACEIFLFSDSIFITGEKIFDALKLLNGLYSHLLYENLLLRGAIVRGRLTFQHRYTIENFEKKLPIDDTLARASGLEKIHKGARLIVENNLAETLFSNCPEWLTNEGYSRNRNLHPENSEILRKICPTPDNTHFEMLYNFPDEIYEEDLKKVKKDLTYMIRMSGPDLKIHYSETLELIKRAEIRFRLTDPEFV